MKRFILHLQSLFPFLVHLYKEVDFVNLSFMYVYISLNIMDILEYKMFGQHFREKI